MRNPGRGKGDNTGEEPHFGPGRGRGNAPRDAVGRGTVHSWRHNVLYKPGGTEMETGQGSEQEMSNQDARQTYVLGKRSATDTQQVLHGGSNLLAIIPSMPTTSKVVEMVNQIEGETLPGITPEASSTPQKMLTGRNTKSWMGRLWTARKARKHLRYRRPPTWRMAGSNENPSLELSGPWATPDSSGTSVLSTHSQAQACVPVRDAAKQLVRQ